MLTHPLDAHTERTIVDPADLHVELAFVRERGYAIEQEEAEAGSGGVAAAVFDHNGEAIAALGLDVSADRIAEEGEELARTVSLAATALSEALGFTGVRSSPDEQSTTSSTMLAMVPAARSYAA